MALANPQECKDCGRLLRINANDRGKNPVEPGANSTSGFLGLRASIFSDLQNSGREVFVGMTIPESRSSALAVSSPQDPTDTAFHKSISPIK
jgi:hypothetical protein